MQTWPTNKWFPSFTSFWTNSLFVCLLKGRIAPLPDKSNPYKQRHVSIICLDIQELVPIVPLKHAANGNLESSSKCVVQYICRQTNDFLVSCNFGPIPCKSDDFTGFWHVSFICLDIQELVPIVPLKHAANGNLESSSECVVQYICRHGGQNGQYANSAIENSADAMPCH